MSEKGSIFSEQTNCVGFASSSGVFPARHSGCACGAGVDNSTVTGETSD